MRKSRLHIGREFNRDLGLVFNEVAEVYDRVRPAYPDELFEDLVAITGLNHRSSILEVGCGTGQATRSLAALGCSIAAVEPGEALAALARHKLEAFPNVEIETTTFEQWHDRNRRFDILVAASSWHWVDPSVGWRRAHDVLKPRGWLALLGNVVARRPGELEVYAESADLHERFCPGNPDWGHPPRRRRSRAAPRCNRRSHPLAPRRPRPAALPQHAARRPTPRLRELVANNTARFGPRNSCESLNNSRVGDDPDGPDGPRRSRIA